MKLYNKMEKSKILITGGNGNIAKIIFNNLHHLFYIESPSRTELNILNLIDIQKYLENKNSL